MNDNSQGSKSKSVVLISSLFLLALSIGSAYSLCVGPNLESVFFVLRTWYLFYPIMLCSFVLFGCISVIGFKKFIVMPKQ